MVAGLTLASVVSQVGCVTVVVIIGALAVGIALDKTLDTRPLFTILFMLGSIPVSLYLLVRIALSAVARLNPPRAKTAEDEGVSEKAPSERVPSKEE
jgi:F0F1-type ATP synthase assembly protein I